MFMVSMRVFILPSRKTGAMFLHLEFTDHSNPFVWYGPQPEQTTRVDCLQQLQTWRKRFDVVKFTEESGGLFVLLQERRPAWVK